MGANEEITPTIEIFDIVKRRWKSLYGRNDEMRLPRTNHSVACHNGILYIVNILKNIKYNKYILPVILISSRSYHFRWGVWTKREPR